MRALIDIEEKHIRELDQLAASQKRSRAALVREAVADYLRERRRREGTDAFGLWGGRKGDGLDYQEKIRGEW